MSQSPKTDFQPEHDVISEFLEQDKPFGQARAKAYTEYRRQLEVQTRAEQPSWWESLQTGYVRLLYSFTHNALAASALMLIIVTTVGVSAAELALPKESKYRPSNIARSIVPINRQPEKDPYTQFASDTNNDVVSFQECDLAIKYPKQLNSQTLVGVYQGNRTATSTSELGFASIYARPADSYDFGGYGTSIACYTEERDLNNVNTRSITQQELRQLTTWFIAEADLSNIRLLENTNIKHNYELFFTFRDKHYQIGFQTKAVGSIDFSQYDSFQGIFASQVQLQFNSLVTSQPNNSIQTAPANPQPLQTLRPKIDRPVVQPLESDLGTHVAVIPECDLSANFVKQYADPTQPASQPDQVEIRDVTAANPSQVFQKLVAVQVVTEPGQDFPLDTIRCGSKQNLKDIETKLEQEFKLQQRSLTFDQVVLSKTEFCAAVRLSEPSCEMLNEFAVEQYTTETADVNRFYLFTTATNSYYVDSQYGLITRLQFDSLAPAKPDVSVTDKSKVGKFIEAVRKQDLIAKGLRSREKPCEQTIGAVKIWGMIGEVLDGPQQQKCQGKQYTWYKIKWEDGSIGWSVDENMKFSDTRPESKLNLQLKLEGEGCKSINEIDQTKANLECWLVDAKTDAQVTVIRDCKQTEKTVGTCLDSIDFGRKLADRQYLIYRFGDAGYGRLRIQEYVLTTRTLKDVGNYIFQYRQASADNTTCLDADLNTYTVACYPEATPTEIENIKQQNTEFLDAEKKYSNPPANQF